MSRVTLFKYLCRLYTGSCEEYIKRTVVQTGRYLVLKVTQIVNVTQTEGIPCRCARIGVSFNKVKVR